MWGDMGARYTPKHLMWTDELLSSKLYKRTRYERASASAWEKSARRPETPHARVLGPPGPLTTRALPSLSAVWIHAASGRSGTTEREGTSERERVER